MSEGQVKTGFGPIVDVEFPAGNFQLSTMPSSFLIPESTIGRIISL